MSDHREPVSANGQPSLKERVRELRLDERLSTTKTTGGSTSWLPWMLCILLAISWAGAGIRWYRNPGTATPAPVISSPSQNAAPVETPLNSKSVDPSEKPSSGELILEKKGYLIAAHQIPISPIDVAGRIIELNFVEGDTKTKGAVLARIDSAAYSADAKEAQAQVDAARARYNELQSSRILEVEQAESELAEALAQADESAIVYETAKSTASAAVAKLEINQAKKKLDASLERVKTLRTKLKLITGSSRDLRIEASLHDLEAAQARLTRANWRLGNCEIKAPVTGIILTKKAEFGSLINPVVGGVSTSLCEMADLSDLEVDLEVDERDISKVFEGQECRIRVDAYPLRNYAGYVDRIMPIANRGKAILPIRVKVIVPAGEKQGSYLKPEMNALVSFYNKESSDYRKVRQKTAKTELVSVEEKKSQP